MTVLSVNPARWFIGNQQPFLEESVTTRIVPGHMQRAPIELYLHRLSSMPQVHASMSSLQIKDVRSEAQGTLTLTHSNALLLTLHVYPHHTF